MLIEQFNAYCKVNTTDPQVHAFLDDRFSEYSKGYFFNTMYQRHLWDGKFHGYNRLGGTFRSGLLKDVLEVCGKEYEFTLKDSRVKPVWGQPIVPQLMFTEDERFRQLRDFQVQSVDIMEAEAIGVIKAATNSGKTEIFCEFVRRTNLRTLVICTRKELFHQTAQRLSTRLGVPIGKIGDGIKKLEQITVVMPSTAVKNVKVGRTKKLQLDEKFKDLLDYDVLLLDECQNLGDSRVSFLVERSQAYYRFAFSGTPFLKDKARNLELKSHFGRVIVEITNQQLIQQGISSVPRCYFIPDNCDDLEGASYDVAYSTGIVYGQSRNAKIVELANLLVNIHHKNVLIVCAQVEHVESLSRELPDAIVSHGGCSSKYRMDVLRRLKAGEISCLITTTIYDEGIDTDQIDATIMAAGMMTPEKILQRLGRGLRAKESMVFWYFDFLDTSNEYLLDHSNTRIKLLKREGFAVKLLTDLSKIGV